MLHPLRRNRLLTLSFILTLGAGVGVTAAMFNLLDLLFFRPPPHVLQPERLVRVRAAANYVQYERLKSQLRSLDLAGYTRIRFTAGFGGEPTALRGECVTPEYFQVLGTPLVRGRGFSTEGGAGAERHVAIIGHGLWKRLFAASDDLARMNLVMAGESYAVIGIAPPEFTGVEPQRVDVWLEMTSAPELCAFTGRSLLGSDSSAWLRTIGRIREPFTFLQADAELRSLLSHAEGANQDVASVRGLQAISTAKRERPDRETRTAQWSAAGALIVLLIACCNVVALMALRTLDRRLEVAVRIQLGATPARVFLLFLLENLLLTFLCVATALTVAFWMDAVLQGFFPLLSPPGLSRRSVGLVVGFALFAGLVSTGISALQVIRANTSVLLRTGQHVVHSGARMRSLLLVVQIALVQLLLVAGTLFVRSVEGLTTQTGYDLEHVIVATLELERHGYAPAEAWRMVDQLIERTGRIPAVSDVSVSSATILGSGGAVVGVSLSAAPLAGDGFPGLKGVSTIIMNAISADYFATLGTRILRGRGFSAADGTNTKLVGIIDEGLAKAHWPGQNPIGKCVFLGRGQACIEVVGVSETRRSAHLTVDQPEFFVPATQVSLYQSLHQIPRTVLFRSNTSVRKVIPSIVGALQSIAPGVSASDVRPLLDLADRQTRSWRLGARTFYLYGVLAAVMAALGLYGTLALTVRQRTAELALRMTLGATPVMVATMILRSVLILLCAGWFLGTASAMWMGRLMERLLFNVTPGDPQGIVAVTLFLLIVALVGCMFPLVRVVRLNPSRALREDN